VDWYFGEGGSILPFPGSSGVVDEQRQCGRQWGEEGRSLEKGEGEYYAEGRREDAVESSSSSPALGRSS
jgi:hypothetical protein